MDRLTDRELLEEVVKALVLEPEQASVLESAFLEAGTTHLLIRVANADRGKIIGRSGRTAEALRTIFGAMAALHGRRVFIEIEETKRRGDAA